MRAVKNPRVVIAALLGSFALVAAACTPPPSGPGSANWKFEGTQVTVNDSQDETCVLGICSNSSDEPYLIQIGWRVKIGVPNSASTFVVNARDFELSGMDAGDTANLSGGATATATFNNVPVLGLTGALNPDNNLEIVGTYTWAVESDTIGIGTGANGTADVFTDALNATLAQASVPSDPNVLVDLIVDNLGNAFDILVSNIPTFGLGDDTLGGAVYVGIGAVGTLGSLIGQATAGVSFPAINLLGDNQVPPKIVGGGFYTMNGPRTFQQAFNGAGGSHTYTFYAGPVT